MDIIIGIIFGAVSGWLASQIMGTKGGLIRNIIIGIVGGFVGNWLFGLLHLSLPIPGILASILVSVIGACVLIFVARLIFK